MGAQPRVLLRGVNLEGETCPSHSDGHKTVTVEITVSEKDVSSNEPCPTQTGVTVSVTDEVSGSREDVQNVPLHGEPQRRGAVSQVLKDLPGSEVNTNFFWSEVARSSPQCNDHVPHCAQQHVLLRDVSSGAEPYPSQTGVTVSVTVQISGSQTDVWRSHGKDNHKGEEEYGGTCRIHPFVGQHDVLLVKKKVRAIPFTDRRSKTPETGK